VLKVDSHGGAKEQGVYCKKVKRSFDRTSRKGKGLGRGSSGRPGGVEAVPMIKNRKTV